MWHICVWLLTLDHWELCFLSLYLASFNTRLLPNIPSPPPCWLDAFLWLRCGYEPSHLLQNSENARIVLVHSNESVDLQRNLQNLIKRCLVDHTLLCFCHRWYCWKSCWEADWCAIWSLVTGLFSVLPHTTLLENCQRDGSKLEAPFCSGGTVE